MRPDSHEIYARRRSRNRGLGLVLGAFVVLIFAVTVVKMHEGADMRGYDHTVETLLRLYVFAFYTDVVGISAALIGTETSGPINHARTVRGRDGSDVLFLMCDSSIPGRNDGRLDDATISWLSDRLTATSVATPVFIAFHHPPVDLLMPFMDSIRQRDEGTINLEFQAAELDYLIHSESGRRTIAENYVGLPLDYGEPGTGAR